MKNCICRLVFLILLFFIIPCKHSFCQEYTMPSFVHAIDACDMDMDGSMDIIVSCSYEDSIVILFNDGYGNFSPNYFGRITSNLICGCIDGDNIPDIVTGKEGYLYFIKNNGDKTLGENISLIEFTGTYTLYGLTDINNDGWNDIFYQNNSAFHWGFLKNSGNLTFTDYVIYYGHSSRPYIGDLNSDDLPDLTVSFPDPISDTKVYINNGNFNFSTFEVLDIIISDPIILELNDSIPQDLALIETPAPDIYFYKNTGNAIFEFQGDNPLLNSHALVVNDYNDYDQDGYTDLCYSQCYLSGCNDSVYVSLNTHDWSFGSAQSYYIGTLNWFRMKSADLNGDGYPDFYMTGYNSNSKIKILWNNGDGAFSYLNPVGIKDEKIKEYLNFGLIPNPFTSITKIKFNCTKKSLVSLKVVDMLGLERIRLLNNQKKSVGDYLIRWDGHDASGNKCEPGAYIMILEINGNQYPEKIIHY